MDGGGTLDFDPMFWKGMREYARVKPKATLFDMTSSHPSSSSSTSSGTATGTSWKTLGLLEVGKV